MEDLPRFAIFVFNFKMQAHSCDQGVVCFVSPHNLYESSSDQVHIFCCDSNTVGNFEEPVAVIIVVRNEESRFL
jgi:hypothetical protein